MRLLLLGPPHFELAGRPLKISRRKVIALLAYLAVTGEIQRREALASLLWPDYDESKAHAYLRRTLWSLRKALGDEWLITEREHIRLTRHEDLWLDVVRFRQLQSESRAHSHPSDELCADCLPLLSEAVDLYRNDFLTGFTLPDCPGFDEWQFFQAEGLRQELASALERLIWGHSRHGDFDTAIPYARRWLSLDPLHEPAHQQLMRLYSWSGQQAAALRQYQECVRLFDEEFGTPPSEETTALVETIRAKRLSPPTETRQPLDLAEDRQRRADEESPADPVQEQEGREGAEELSAPFLRRPAIFRHNLPPQPTSFIGREAELDALDDLITNPEARLITIVGPGGMGKTRLSIQAAHQSLEAFPDGVYFVPLAPLSSADFLISAITDALNLTIYGATDPKTQLLNHLGEKVRLLVLDNFEHLLSSPPGGGTGLVFMGSDLLSEMVLAAPKVKLMITSRERLNLQEEWVFELQGMAFPGVDQSGGDAAPSAPSEAVYSALQLFALRARQVQASFNLIANYSAVVRICQLVNGMPLGLELAASWVKLMSCREIATEIEQNLDLLATSMRNVPERHRSLRAVFEHSWELLSEAEREVLKKLSVFRGGFQREAAREVTGASLSLLAVLVDKSLLQHTEAGRYEIHELLRQYAAEKLGATAAERELVQAAHARYYANFLHSRAGDLHGGRQQGALAEVAAELDNVRASWRWAVAGAEMDLIGKSLEGLYHFSEMRGRVREGEAAIQQAVARLTELGLYENEATADKDKVILGTLKGRQGQLCGRIGSWQQGLELEEQGILMLRQVKQGAEVQLAAALNKFALSLYFVAGELDKTKQLVQEALALATAVGSKVEMAYAYNVMGHLAEFQGEYAEAGPLFEASIQQYKEIGEQRGCAYAQNNWGRAAYAMGEYEQAQTLIQAALAIRREFDDLIGLGYSLLDLGKLAKMQGQYAAAKHYIQEALGFVEEVGVSDSIARCYHGLGMVAEAEGNFERAEELHQKSLTIYHEIGVKRALPLTLNHLSRTAYEQGRYQLAQQRLQACLAACDEMANRGERASALRHLGHVAVKMGNYPDAGGYFRHSLEILVETGARPVALDVLVGWAMMVMKQARTDSDAVQAAELLGLVQDHAASEHETKEKAGHLLAEWAADIPLVETMMAGWTGDTGWDLETAITNILAA